MARTPARVERLRDGSAVTLRPARAPDAPALVELDLEVAAEGIFTPQTPEEVGKDLRERRRRIARFARDPMALLLVAEAGGEVVAGVSVRPGDFRRTRHALSLGISVRRAWRARGVGRALVRAAVAFARSCPGCREVWLRVFSTNAGAVALYASEGFVEEARVRGMILLDDGTAPDDVWMVLDPRPGAGVPG